MKSLSLIMCGTPLNIAVGGGEGSKKKTQKLSAKIVMSLNL